jgi:two-component system, OmpR family, response regulator
MPPGAGVRVLCVDDTSDVVNSLVALFDLSGFDARGCLCGPTALEAAPEFRPHVCVLDVNMPVMDGCELARRLREVLGPEVVLIALSGAAADELEERVRGAGFDRTFTKPPDIARLLEAVAAADPAAQRKTGS